MAPGADRSRHIADRMTLPAGYVARPYQGSADHEAMAAILSEQHLRDGTPALVTAEHIGRNYANVTNCDLDRDVFVVETDAGDSVAYGRTAISEMADGEIHRHVFAPTRDAHVSPALFHALADGLEEHHRIHEDAPSAAIFCANAGHPGPGEDAVGEAAWLESRGYAATQWSATLVRPHLDDIPDLSLPEGVELRPATEDQLRMIVEAHHEAFRGEWDFVEDPEADFLWILDDPHRDHTLWQVAWVGDEVVGQVKPFINHEENEQRGYLRGYTEFISTHTDWRNRGIAGALLARSLSVLKERGMTEAALGVDTNNPGGAFQLYTKLGFELTAYEVFYSRPLAD